MLGRSMAYGVPAACLMHTVFDYAGEIQQAYGPSMLPTLQVYGDAVLIERFGRWRNRLKTGELVVFYSPQYPGRRAVKRILGMAGDTVCVDPTVDPYGYVKVPPGHVWLQGDNYASSTDSRIYGPIPLGLLRGRVLARLYPGGYKSLASNAEVIPGSFDSQDEKRR